MESRKTVQVARLDNTKSQAPANLPQDIKSDLDDSFKYYDKENYGYISVDHFHNILHNFGFHKATKKDKDQDINKACDGDFSKCTHVDFPFLKYLVARKWNSQMGAQDEAVECFRLFNKRGHETITAAEIKTTMMDFLDFNITDQDMNDFMSVIDKDGSGQIDYKKFA
jgi:Ca2+-binding EF-hand superfamily protein